MPTLQPALLPTPNLAALAPSPPATVHVRNLTTTLTHAGHDAWNRARKAQPCQLSATVTFASGFDAAASTDALGGGDTVHYGTLSKALLARVGRFDAACKEEEEEAAAAGRERSVGDVLGDLWRGLTGVELNGEAVAGVEGKGKGEKGLLDLGRVRMLAVTVGLPKASLLGEGVKMTGSAVFEEGGSGKVEGWARALEVSRLRVPTLVGVNDNERLAKQFVVTTVTVEGFTREEDVYTEIEAVVVKALEGSSFETLEALGAHLAERVLTSKWHQDEWQVCIKMEKPTAVPMADCPIVEVRATRASLKRAKAAGAS